MKKITTEQLNILLKYLSSRPYVEVYQLIQLLKKDFQVKSLNELLNLLISMNINDDKLHQELKSLKKSLGKIEDCQYRINTNHIRNPS